MSNIIKTLADLANALDESNLSKTANAIDAINGNVLKITKAQYEGFMGYWIRNGRCWQNCYRQKRTTTGLAAQEVWNECHEEYLESFGKDKSDWDKYANNMPNMKKTANISVAKLVSAEEKRFHNGIKESMKKGMDRPTAIFATINSNKERISSYLIAQAQQVAKVATDLDYAGYKKLAEKAANASAELAKHAQTTEFAAPPKSPMRDLGNAIKGHSEMHPAPTGPGQTGVMRGLGRGVRNIPGVGKLFGGQIRNIQNQIFNMMKYVDSYAQGGDLSKIQELKNSLENESSNLSQAAAIAKNKDVANLARQAITAINSFTSNISPQMQLDQVQQQMYIFKKNLQSVHSGSQEQLNNIEQGSENPYAQMPKDEPPLPRQATQPPQESTLIQDAEMAGGVEAVLNEMFREGLTPIELDAIVDHITSDGEFEKIEGDKFKAAISPQIQSQSKSKQIKFSKLVTSLCKIAEAQNMTARQVVEKYKPKIMNYFTSTPNKDRAATYLNKSWKANNWEIRIVDRKGLAPGDPTIKAIQSPSPTADTATTPGNIPGSVVSAPMDKEPGWSQPSSTIDDGSGWSQPETGTVGTWTEPTTQENFVEEKKTRNRRRTPEEIAAAKVAKEEAKAAKEEAKTSAPTSAPTSEGASLKSPTQAPTIPITKDRQTAGKVPETSAGTPEEPWTPDPISKIDGWLTPYHDKENNRNTIMDLRKDILAKVKNTQQQQKVDTLLKQYTRTLNPKTNYETLFKNISNIFKEKVTAKTKTQIFKEAMSPSARKTLKSLLKGF